MFTDCPDCNRQFHLNAEQLSAANGMVRCGFCDCRFNAVERLHDKPLSVARGEIPGIVEPPRPGAGLRDGEIQPGEPPPVVEPQYPPATTPEPLPEDTYKASGINIGIEKEEESSCQDMNLQVPYEGLESGDIDELVAEPPSKPGIMNKLLWGFGALLLLIIATAQLAWFKRDDILARYPQFRPLAIQICERIQCEPVRYRDLAAIKVINRDVREHPRFENALLVNATMSNQSHTVQPFPDIQLVLFDTNGDQIAYRDFRPQDYLDTSIDILDGMQPDTPVHFVLEVTGPTEGAVSFEFNFH